MKDFTVSQSPRPPRGPAWNVPAAIAGWVLPGLGHLLIGDVFRGLILATAITLLWLGGLLVGGINVVQVRDAQGHFRPWFLGQMLIAPSLAVEYTHDSYRAQNGGTDPLPQEDGALPAYTPSYGRVHEIGTLYTALAGLLNLLAIVDVIYRQPNPVTVDSTAKPDPKPGPKPDAPQPEAV